jgi:integrase/recombinase XerD
MDKRASELIVNFHDYLLLENGLSVLSIKAYCADVERFLNFIDKTFSVKDEHFTQSHIEAFLKENIDHEASSNARFLCSLRAFTNFLKKEKLIDNDPCVRIENPKLIRNIPHVMSEGCVAAFLDAPDLNTHTGLRDKAMLETVYATGLRISELISLKFDNVFFQDGFVMVRGKGDKERIVPLCDDAIYWIELYINTKRKEKDPQRKCPFIFLSGKGIASMSRIAFWYRIKVYGKQLGLTDSFSPHSFRHAFATHLLNHDADLRSVQMLLGHSSLTTTQIYTHVATERMHQVYNKAHPRS